MWKTNLTASTLIVAAALGGCAGMNQLSSDVSTFSQWPAQRKPGSYAFERLPSQQANPDQQRTLEDAAARAMESAGFTSATDARNADVSVQLGARVNAQDRSPYDDPFWWRGGLYRSNFGRPHTRAGLGFGLGFGFGFGGLGYSGMPNYEREVAVLIRDKKSGEPLYEARATNDGGSPSINSLLGAMYEAALKDFPASGTNPRRVTTPITP